MSNLVFYGDYISLKTSFYLISNFSEKLSTDKVKYPQIKWRTCVLMHKLWITCGEDVVYLYIVVNFSHRIVYKIEFNCG